MSTTQSFAISKHLVYEAFEAVNAKEGAAGVNGQSIEDFERDLKDNPYKVWNRMSSGAGTRVFAHPRQKRKAWRAL